MSAEFEKRTGHRVLRRGSGTGLMLAVKQHDGADLNDGSRNDLVLTRSVLGPGGAPLSYEKSSAIR